LDDRPSGGGIDFDNLPGFASKPATCRLDPTARRPGRAPRMVAFGPHVPQQHRRRRGDVARTAGSGRRQTSA
jgi:hypothetical protein